MGVETKIEWCDHTFNPWIGCTKVSPACDHCYAETLMAGRYRRVAWGAGQRRQRTSPANWKEPLRWGRAAAKAGVRRRVFCASLADVFDAEVPDAWRLDLMILIWATPSLDWLLLTKRPQVAKKFFEHQAMPKNVWLGTTVENQAMADLRIPILLSIPARVRFLSIEPMLGPISFRMLDWVIAGGESGPKARPSHPDWFRTLRDQCRTAGVPFFFKQWGEYAPNGLARERWIIRADGSADPRPTPNGIAYHAPRDGASFVYRVGKARAGALLDGREHREFPAEAKP